MAFVLCCCMVKSVVQQTRHHMQLLTYGTFLVNQLHCEAMTDKERRLPSLTRRRLKSLKNWDEWDATYDKQLDQYHSAGVFGEPVLRSTLSPEEQGRVLDQPRETNRSS